MAMKFDKRMVWRALAGAPIIYATGNFLTPYLNNYLSIIPTNLLGNFLGLTPHIILAYSVGVYAAEWIADLIPALKRQ